MNFNTSFVVLYSLTLNPPIGGSASYDTGYDAALDPAER